MSGTNPNYVADVRNRLDWASTHIDRFETGVNAFLCDCSCQETVEEKTEWREPYYIRVVTFRAWPSVAVPMSLRLMAGDAIQGLRASVDNLVWSLGQCCGAKSSLGFFFSNTPEGFQKRAVRARFSKLPPVIQTWMEDQQIYRRSDGVASPLNSLNTLWNDDKHKVPALVSSASPSVHIGAKSVGHLDLVDVNTTEDGKVVIVTEGGGHLNPEFVVEVRFPTLSTSATTFLRDIHKHICEDVLPRFEPHFQ